MKSVKGRLPEDTMSAVSPRIELKHQNQPRLPQSHQMSSADCSPIWPELENALDQVIWQLVSLLPFWSETHIVTKNMNR